MTPAFLFGLRIFLTWTVLLGAAGTGLWILSGYKAKLGWVVLIMGIVWVSFIVSSVITHIKRVQLIAGRVDAMTLSPRQRRQVEVPFEAQETFDIVEAAIRGLPNGTNIDCSRPSLQLKAKVKRISAYDEWFGWDGLSVNRVAALVQPRDGSSTVTLMCEPDTGGWDDWFTVDDGTNLENAEAILRTIAQRVADQRRVEQAEVRTRHMEKELTEAKLGQLQAQIEPHFLYNTLANAQLLTRSDPKRADEMLEHLIGYLRDSLQGGSAQSTLGREVERSRAYLEILKIRMGARLGVQVDVPENLLAHEFPPMMLQTLVENAIKHGLEAKPGGGTVWIRADASDGKLRVTVADDGQGFSDGSSGTGLGLKNVRERLRLAYGDAASLALSSNYPAGVAATIVLPM